MRIRLRALLAIALLAGLYVLAFVVVLFSLAVLVLSMVAVWSAPEPGTQALSQVVFLATGCMIVVGAVGYGLFSLAQQDVGPAGSVAVSRSDQPALWELVERIAAEVGTAAPVQLRLVAEANAAVIEDRLLGGRTARRMFVGVPLLVGLPAAELRAVIGHELGHYAGRHTRFGATVYAGAAALDRTRERLLHAAMAGGVPGGYATLVCYAFNGYARLYQRVSLTVRRRQELEADAVAAQVAGRGVAAAALRDVYAVQLAWQDFGAELDRYQRIGYVPDEPYRAFGSVLADPGYQAVLAAARADPPDRPASPRDSHPSLAQRLRALDRLPAERDDPDDPVKCTERNERDERAERDKRGDPDGPDGGRPIELAEAPRRRWPAARTGATRTGSPTMVQPYRQWLDLVAEARAIEPARALVRAATRLTDGRDATLGVVLSLLEAGRQHELAEALAWLPGPTGPTGSVPTGPTGLADADEPADLAALAVALFALVGQSLVSAGRASWQIRWTALPDLRSDQVPVGELAAVVGAALRRPRDVARLRLHLASHGVAVDVPVVLARDVPAADTITVTPATNEAARAERRVRVRTLWLVLGTLAVFGVVALLSPGRSPVHPIGGTRIPYPGLQSDHRFPPPYPTYTLYPTYTGYPLPTGYPGLPLPGIDPTSIIGPPHLDLTGTIVLRRGDTLALLACRYHTTVAELRRLNDLGGSTRLIAGAPFRVPLVFATGGTCR